MSTECRGAKTGLPSELQGSQGKILHQGVPRCLLEEIRERGLGPRSTQLSHPTHSRAGFPAIHQPAGPLPHLGPRSHPPAPSRGGVETEEEMGEGRPGSSSLHSPSSLATIFRPLPPRAAGDGAQPVEGRERAGGGLAGAAGAAAGPNCLLPPPPRSHGDRRSESHVL